ncbi:ABC-type glycerol-3-phosphate transport system substrate-binding protein [Cupriavidus necator]|nr:ABC-type glycerol-3-phosphate transport system substrate-binding protein [Cupriavidus necator]
MQDKCSWRKRLLAVVALATLLGGCAGGSRADGTESSITTYGTVDVGISHTR